MFSIDDMCRRQADMEAQRSNWDTLWEQVARKLNPVSDDFRSKHARGQVRTNRQYDSFPAQALTRYAAAMESGLTPRVQMWHKLSTGDAALDEDDEVKAYLEAMNRVLWRNRYRPASNFAGQNHEMLMSHGSFGNGCMFVDRHPEGGTAYRSIHLSQMFVAEDSQGFIDTFHRKFTMTARQIHQKIEQDGWDMTSRVSQALKTRNFEQEFEVLHVVMPREDYDPDRLDHKGMKYTNVYILVDGKEPMLQDSGFREKPYMFARDVTSSRELYGRGPGTQMFPDIKMLNEIKRTIIDVANMASDPITLLPDDGLLGEFRMLPGSRVYGGVDDQGRQLVVPYNNGADPGVGLDLIQDTRNQIDDAFLGIYFRVLRENPQMTATQALLISQQQGQMTSPPVGRMQSEYLDPMIRRESGLLFRQDKHPPMPRRLTEYLQAGEKMKIEYESPLVRAARTGEAVALQTTFEALSPWAQVMGPEVFARFDPVKVAKTLAEVNGVPQDVMKSDEQMDAEDEQKAQQQAAAMALEAAPVAAETAERLSSIQAGAGDVQLPV